MNGQIYLNFVGMNPVFCPYKPGLIKYYEDGHVVGESSLGSMVHSDMTEPNMAQSRNQVMTQPWLGENVYAEKRRDPMIPWLPDDGSSGKEALVVKETKED